MGNFYYIPAHGQSLSIGDQGFPLTHTSETWGDGVNLFNGVGPTGPGFEYDLLPADIASLQNYKEISKETHQWAMFNFMDGQGVLTGRWLLGPAGVGGKNIDALTFDGLPHKWGWGNVVDMVTASKALTPVGDTYTVPFTTWIQGEADSGDPTGYNEKLRDYHDRLMNETGGSYPLFLDQTGKNNSFLIATELLEYYLENNDAVLALPKWWLNRNYPEATGLRLHLNANGYMLQGEYFGRAVSDYLSGSNSFQPVYPKSWSVGGDNKTLTVEFNTGSGRNLTIDSSIVPLAPSLGMGYYAFDGFGLNPATSYVKNGNSIVFTFDEPLNTETLFDIGNTLDDRGDTDNVKLPCINLRDDSVDISPTQGINLYNWCCQRRWGLQASDGVLDRRYSNLWYYGDFDGSINPNDTILGRNTEQLLQASTQYRVDYTSTIRSGQANFWVGDTRVLVRFDETQSVLATVTTAKRLYLQGGSGGFDGTLSATVTKCITSGFIYVGGTQFNATDSDVWVRDRDDALYRIELAGLSGNLTIYGDETTPLASDPFWSSVPLNGFTLTVERAKNIVIGDASKYTGNAIIDEQYDSTYEYKTAYPLPLAEEHNVTVIPWPSDSTYWDTYNADANFNLTVQSGGGNSTSFLSFSF